MKNKFPCLTCKYHRTAEIELGGIKSDNKEEFPDITITKIVHCCDMYLDCDVRECEYYELDDVITRMLDIARGFTPQEDDEDGNEKKD